MTPSHASLFERPLPDGYRDELRDQLAEPLAETKRQTSSTLIFQLGGVRLGLPANIVFAVAPTLHIARIPHRSGTVLLGLTAFRGNILPCCSLARLLDLQQIQSGTARTLILEEAPGRRWAVPIDGVTGVRITSDEPSGESSPIGTQWLRGSYKDESGDFHLIDPDVLFRQITLATA